MPVGQLRAEIPEAAVNIDRSGGSSAGVDSQRRFAAKTRRSPSAYPSDSSVRAGRRRLKEQANFGRSGSAQAIPMRPGLR